jgi:hypothetical protein
MTPVVIQEQGKGITGSYQGVHDSAARRFLSFSIGNSTKIVTFYYEALDMDAMTFEKRKREVIGSVQVTN